MKPEEVVALCVVGVGAAVLLGPSMPYFAWKTGMVHYPVSQVMKFGADEIMAWTVFGQWPWDQTTVANLGSLKEMSAYADAVTRTFYNNQTFLERQRSMAHPEMEDNACVRQINLANSASYGNTAFMALYSPDGVFWMKFLRCMLKACMAHIPGCYPQVGLELTDALKKADGV